MPDESCRICGGTLVNCSLCPECKKVIQRICSLCGLKTENQLHGNCLYLESHHIKNKIGTKIVASSQLGHKKTDTARRIEKEHPLRNTLLIFGVIGFFILGFSTAENFDLFHSDTQQAKTVTVTNISSINPSKVLYKQYENCLGYGNGQTMTVKCPTEVGYVYEAVLHMPNDLASKLSSEVFFLRGITLNENPDGTVVLQYQKNLFKTNFLGS